MRLQRVRLENVRGVEACEVSFRDDGITIVEAPNESGKTTLLDAVDVLFEYKDGSKSSDVRGLQPVGRDVGSTIEVELTCGETHITCRKTFNRQSQTTLQIHSPRPEQLTGTEAHDRLQEILKANFDKTLYDALKIHQGRDLEALSFGDSGALSSALDAAAGGSGASSDGDALFLRARGAYETYFTEKNANPKPLLKEIDKKVADLESERNDLEGRLKDLEKDIKRLSGIERDLPALERRKEDELKPAVARQEKLLQRVRSVEERLKTHAAQRDTAEARLREARRARDERAEHAKRFSELEAEIEKLRHEHAPQQERLAELAKDLEKQGESLERANAAARDARRRREIEEQLVELIGARQELERLRAKSDRVQNINREASEAEEALNRTVLNDELLAEIKNADEEVKVAHAVLSAGAPSVELRAHRDLEVELDGSETSVAAGGRLEEAIGERFSLHVPDVLDLEVRAGASASDLRRRVSDAEARLAEACERAEVADLAEAEEAAARRRRHEGTLERRDEALARELEGESQEEFATRLREAEARTVTAAGRIPEDVEVPEASTAQQRLETARESEESTREAAEETRNAREATAETLRREREASSKNSATLEAREEAAERLRRQLEEARRENPDDALERSVTDAAEAYGLAASALDEVQEELSGLKPETVELETEAARNALEFGVARLNELSRERAALQSRLQVVGAEGLGERLEEIEAGLERARSEQHRQWARARATRMLYTTLREARDEMYRAYRDPLRKGIVEQARLLHDVDDLDVELDEELRIIARTKEGTTLRWEQLSAGAREQLAILTALAAAQIAGDDGVPFVLDDALGYTDPERLARLGALLGSTEGAQVIVLTCAADRFQHVGGARTVRLLEAAGERRDL